jgi:hypothetical protein
MTTYVHDGGPGERALPVTSDGSAERSDAPMDRDGSTVKRRRPPRPVTYNVFVKHRSVRLILQRGIPTLAAAIAFANEVRALRVRDPEKVIVVRHPDGAVIDETQIENAAPPAPDVSSVDGVAPPHAAAPPASSAPPSEPRAPLAPTMENPRPPSACPPPRRSRRPSAERLSALADLYERLRNSSAQQSEGVVVHARFERAFAAAEATLATGGDYPSEQIRRV